MPFGDHLVDRLPYRAGRIHRVFEFLRTAICRPKTEIAECMKDFVTQNKRRGLAVVISDFYDPKGFEQGINTLRYYKFEPFVLQVYDLREASPKLHGDLALVDCETGDIREVTVSKSLLEAYEKEHEKYCKELEAYCTKYAMPFFGTHTSIRSRARAEDLPLRGFQVSSSAHRLRHGVRRVGPRARDRRTSSDAAPPLRVPFARCGACSNKGRERAGGSSSG